MRVAMISEHASPLATLGGVDAGGQNAHVAELSLALAEAGHEVHVYTRRDDPNQPTVVPLATGVTVLHVPAGPPVVLPKDDLLPYMDGFSRWLADRWRDPTWRPDVAHAHFWMSGLAAVPAARRTGIPVVQTYHALGTVKRRHQGPADTSPPGRITYERAIGQAVDRVIAQCQDEVRELTQLGVPRSRITVVPSGVDQRIFTPEGPAAPRDPNRSRILTVGRLVERKGYQDVIQAIRTLPQVECVVVGGPPGDALDRDPYARRLRDLATSLGVADRVRLVGAVPRDEMPFWYRSADLLVAAPWYEPFGLTPLEAMACGVPVVATAVGGLTDTVVPDLTGDLVPPRDPAALSAALRRLLADRKRRQAYGAAALDRARRHYCWERAAEQLEAVYASVVGLLRASGVVA